MKQWTKQIAAEASLLNSLVKYLSLRNFIYDVIAEKLMNYYQLLLSFQNTPFEISSGIKLLLSGISLLDVYLRSMKSSRN